MTGNSPDEWAAPGERSIDRGEPRLCRRIGADDIVCGMDAYAKVHLPQAGRWGHEFYPEESVQGPAPKGAPKPTDADRKLAAEFVHRWQTNDGGRSFVSQLEHLLAEVREPLERERNEWRDRYLEFKR